MRLNADEKDKIWTRVYDVRLQEMIEKLGDIHDERIKNGGFKNGDGLFPRGQDVLKALTSQCYCLVLETL